MGINIIVYTSIIFLKEKKCKHERNKMLTYRKLKLADEYMLALTLELEFSFSHVVHAIFFCHLVGVKFASFFFLQQKVMPFPFILGKAAREN